MAKSDSTRLELRKWSMKVQTLRVILEDYSIFAHEYSAEVNNLVQVRVRLDEVAEFSKKFNEYQSQIEMLQDSPDEEWITIRRNFSNYVCDVKASLLKIMDDHAKIKENSASPSFSSIASQSNLNSFNAMRYPPCPLPTFSGDWQQWSSFIDTFNSMFHNEHSSLPLVQRFHYLKSCLNGQASDVIKSIPTTAENFLRAYHLLVNRYENKGAIIQSHIRALLDIPKVVTPSRNDLQNLHHHMTSNINALRSLQQPVEHWDAWLVTLLLNRIDSSTVGEWYLQYKKKDLPSYTEVEEFLFNRITAYEAGDINSCTQDMKKTAIKAHAGRTHDKKVFLTNKKDKNHTKCPACPAQHKLYMCDKFKQMSITDKKNIVTNANLCFNCLNYGHQVASCYFPSCPKCGQRHNSKLHQEQSGGNASSSLTTAEVTPIVDATAMCTGVTNNKTSNLNVLLATAIVNICDKFGRMHSCRAVLDSGSQLNFITQSCAKKLKLSTSVNAFNIVGVSSMSSSAKQLEDTTICSRFGNYKANIKLHSLPVIINELPSQMVVREDLKIPRNLECFLADPQYYVPGPIDLLLGAEIFFEIFSSQKLQLSENAALIHTKLGWIVTGKVLTVPTGNVPSALIINHNSALSLFVSKANQRTSEELKAEEHFQKTFRLNIDGRFVVKLPLVQKPNVLGNSLSMAQKRFFNLERRFANDSSLAKQYDNFIQEYVTLGHMELSSPITDKPTYYLPHHPVFKVDSSTTKLRVVFDGSAKSTSGLSLNDIMLKGPKIQPDIFNILLRFRLHRVALTADVAKMYRQVLVDADDCYLQRIVYRTYPDEPLKHYNLKTVTYGTKSASFLATRCLSQLGHEYSNTSIGQIICQDFYVDDLISGGDTDEECFSMYKQLQSALGSVGFPLRKWCSSSRTLLSSLPHAQDDPNFMVNLSEDEVVSALGLLWQPSIDSFRFVMKSWTPPEVITKRSLLSNLNSVFDPIGFISSVLIKGKIFIQQVWSLKMNWDEPLPKELYFKWVKFYSSLAHLNQLIIPRLAIVNCANSYELHGFCDASQHAFGACVYLLSRIEGRTTVNLYTSRSRVAPIKATTIPRLELCGALLLAELISEVEHELTKSKVVVSRENVCLWTDSTIVLAWIKSLSLFQAYVANRIARINDLSCSSQWHHTTTTQNPADLISRGIDVGSIVACRMWWHGPEWLSQERENWPKDPTLPSDIPEVRPIKMVLTATTTDSTPWILKKYSNWFTLLRITALVYRFLFNCKSRRLKCNRRIGFISMEEINRAKTFWIAHSQRESFSKELSSLRAGETPHRGSCLKTLNPFVDSEGLIRVGGRLDNASINYNAKHPLILSAKSVVTRLIFNYEHRRLMHIGPQALLSHVSSSYWVIRGRILARKIVNHCIQCFRSTPRFMSPLMAPLPRERVIIERPFAKAGLDFCGPIMVRSGIRKVTSIKSYICVFVCMVTRALHLELVSSLSTEDFLATLSRFMSRRGQCSSLYSDNGSNFVGANRVLKKYFAQLAGDKKVNDFLTAKEIKWHFIPPSAPHFGGLWEGAIKSAKRQLVRVTKGVLLTYDETTTILCQVEAALNSRPLFPMSSDPTDFNVLTPGHFLIGGPIMLPPEPDISTIPLNRLRRFKLMQRQMQIFWKRWSKEYLPQVQRRGKWTKVCRNPVVGDLAILKDDTLPPTHWPLVRIIHTYPGADDVVRVVTVRNSSGLEYRRPVVKLAILPKEDDEDVEDITL